MCGFRPPLTTGPVATRTRSPGASKSPGFTLMESVKSATLPGSASERQLSPLCASRGVRPRLRIPTKPITDSGVKPITQSSQADHLSERSDAGVATHLRQFRAGSRCTIDEHLPPEAIAYKLRDPQWCLRQSEDIGAASRPHRAAVRSPRPRQPARRTKRDRARPALRQRMPITHRVLCIRFTNTQPTHTLNRTAFSGAHLA